MFCYRRETSIGPSPLALATTTSQISNERGAKTLHQDPDPTVKKKPDPDPTLEKQSGSGLPTNDNLIKCTFFLSYTIY